LDPVKPDLDERSVSKPRTRNRDNAQSRGTATPPANDAARVARTIAWLVVAATPLGLLNGVFVSHDVMPKVIAVLCGAACLLFLISQWSGGVSRLCSTRHGRCFLWLAGGQAALLIVSMFISRQPLLSLVGSTWRRFGAVEQLAGLTIAVAVASLAALKPQSVIVLWRAVIVSAGLASLYGIAQYFSLDPFLEKRLYTLDYLGGILRPPATMGHAIYFSAYLAPLAVIACWQAAHDRSTAWRSAHAAVAVLAPLAILLSGSRGSLLAVIAGGIVLLFFVKPSEKGVVAGAAAVLMAALFVVFAPAGENLRHRIQQWRADPGSVRVAVWRESPRLIARAPLFGSGPETFAGAFREVESAELSRAYPDFINETPHNIFVDAACEEGLIGLVILVGVFALATRGESPGLTAATLAILIAGLFASFSIVTALYLWCIAGIVAAGERKKVETSSIQRDWRAIASPVAVAFTVVALLLAVQDAAYADLGKATDTGNLEAAQQAFVRACSFGTGLPGYELWASQELAKLKAWADAAKAASLAEARGEDRASAAYQSSVLRIVNSDATGAESKATAAILLAPNWYKPHLLHAQVLQAMGRNEEAAREAQLCRTLGWKGK
jgi:hypothetical protein